MFICPRAICRNLICKSAALSVQELEDMVIKAFAYLQKWVACNLIVELICVNLADHIAANSWIVRVGDNFASEENLD